MVIGTCPSQIIRLTSAVHVSLAAAAPTVGNQVLLGVLRSTLAQRPWLLFSSFLSFVVEHLGRSAGSVLALVRGPLSPGCVSPIPAMSEPIRGHSAEAFEGVIGL